VKRFYKSVSVEPAAAGFAVALDGRPIRTPAKAELKLPTPALAEAIAAEWREQGDIILPIQMGLTRLANTGIDRIASARAGVVEDVTSYGGSDLLCYRADQPAALAARQHASWQPWLDWVAERYGARLKVGTGVMHLPQHPTALAALRLAVATAGDLELAGLAAAVQAMGSLVLGLALWQGAIAAEQASDAALLDELFQAEKWGVDHEAAQRWAGLRRDIADAGRFLALLRAR